jgi:hypothetical protein
VVVLCGRADICGAVQALLQEKREFWGRERVGGCAASCEGMTKKRREAKRGLLYPLADLETTAA